MSWFSGKLLAHLLEIWTVLDTYSATVCPDDVHVVQLNSLVLSLHCTVIYTP